MKSKISKSYRKKTRKNNGGGFFTKNKYIVPSGECNLNNLTSIKGSKLLHENYQKCCPKGTFGTKNSSPYCKQVDLNFQAALKEENDANEYHGFEPTQVYQMKQEDTNANAQKKKSWWKIWGGKTRKNKKRKTYRK